MYTSFFGFRENPFNLTPDPRYLFLSPFHKEALDHLLYGITERKGFIAITGGIGTGKTTLCRTLLDYLDDSTRTALIFSAFLSDTELLKAINQEFGIKMDPAAASKKDYIDSLNSFLLDNFSAGRNAVLLIDEAQNLSQTVLEQIRMLSNLETEKEKLIQIVLVGQSELKDLLASPSLRQLNERITVRYDLKPLNRKDVQGYVEHRLVVAGGRGNLRFTSGAFRKIYSYSQGNPRRINAICDRALLVAFAREEHAISAEIIGKAIGDLSGGMAIGPVIKGWPGKKFRLVTLLFLFLVIMTGFAGWNLREDILGLISHDRKTETAMPKHEKATVFLDEQASLAGLFRLFNEKGDKNGSDADRIHLGLISFTIEPEYYVMMKKPFRVRQPGSLPHTPRSSRYLLIREVTTEGAIAVDARGNEQQVSRDFILGHWGREVSCVYPYKNRNTDLMMGMSGPDVLKVQEKLNKTGYLMELTGHYDQSTFHEVVRFQNDFGLDTDGIVGPRTMALLYQMVD